ncbi:zinc-binding dehydrogenase [Microbacterium aurantiacum]|uniref:enoyl-[acyl-carrier-protein] reductase n=1 Tax=Microbacterium aurantiacum TaxID=162393 RepID=A0AAJ2HKD2_9MICO|nr:zinc-binding dehydrogenase [Microbacterium aurantiacum]MDS0246389.1 zinc-binding dehydrogenase [Microbacterium aurantiacum]
MRALMHHTFGEPADVLTLVEQETDEPGPGEVRVRTALAAIHNHDLWTVRGTYGYRPELPARSGTEAVGVIDAVGPDVQGLRVGQRVSSAGAFGVWAESFIARAAALVPVPDEVSDETAAQWISMPFSALSLVDSLGAEEGDWIVQNAANGAVGRLVVPFAAARGIRVLGLVRRSAAVDELTAAGIADVVATDSADWQERAAEIIGGATVRAAVDSVGGQAAGDLVSLLSDAGTLVVFGSMGEPNLSLPTGDIIFRQLTVRGFWGSRVSKDMDTATRTRLMGELVTRISSGEVSLPVEEIFPAAEIADAVRANARAGRAGKVLLRF